MVKNTYLSKTDETAKPSIKVKSQNTLNDEYGGNVQRKSFTRVVRNTPSRTLSRTRTGRRVFNLVNNREKYLENSQV